MVSAHLDSTCLFCISIRPESWKVPGSWYCFWYHLRQCSKQAEAVPRLDGKALETGILNEPAILKYPYIYLWHLTDYVCMWVFSPLACICLCTHTHKKAKIGIQPVSTPCSGNKCPPGALFKWFQSFAPQTTCLFLCFDSIFSVAASVKMCNLRIPLPKES